MQVCVKHHMTGCALCGPSGRGVVAATPPREHATREVRIFDFGLARLEEAMQDMYGRSLTDAERTVWVQAEVLKKAREGVPDFDTSNVQDILEADVLGKTRGKMYRLDGANGTCPKCGQRCARSSYECVSGYAVAIPNFSKCKTCGGEEPRVLTCDDCDSKGWFISSWTQSTAYLACTICTARLRQPTKRGQATNFTTTSRAGEEYARKVVKPGPMCTACQQRSAQKSGKCKACHAEELRLAVVTARTESARLRAEIERLQREQA